MSFENYFPIWNDLKTAQKELISDSLITQHVKKGTIIHNGSLDKRVASFLLEETSIEGTNEIKITHEAIASHLGSHREVITRMLRYFQSEGLVKLPRGKLTILDIKRLEALQKS